MVECYHNYMLMKLEDLWLVLVDIGWGHGNYTDTVLIYEIDFQ